MRGRKPKPDATRRRRNKTSTEAVLDAPPAVETPETRPLRPPPLPKSMLPAGMTWHRQTRREWKDWWESPMASEWLATDRNGLYRAIVVVNQFWWNPNDKLAQAVDKLVAEYGLTSLARMRLHWKIATTDRRPRPETAKEMREGGKDPREALRAVQ